jgi:hypothetical protein
VYTIRYVRNVTVNSLIYGGAAGLAGPEIYEKGRYSL